MPTFPVSGEQISRFKRDGYLMVENLFDDEETDLLGKIARADQALSQDAHNAVDSTGGHSRLALRNELHDDVYSSIVRCHRLVDTMELLLEGEVYHYHHKMMMKEPYVGGAWEWHQDYGYWYNNGCLYPDMASCMIAVDRATQENGCLQVIPGTHLMGRIDHGKSGSQTGADTERVEEILKRFPLVYVEMEPGTALFFHSNLLHRSDKNRSPNPRWAFICCYNTARNNPYKQHHHPCYSYLEKWPDERVKEIAKREWEEMGQKTRP
jgi:ectoine hydroxylase-related dioxygenase (phytanoyl-CoA dioxygenase family)